MSPMLTALLLASSLAHATDVGTTRRFGLGINVGWPEEITGKYWLDEESGIAVGLGAFGFRWFAVRAQYERDLMDLASWDWGVADLYWDVGARLDAYPGSYYTGGGLGVGPFGGVAARIRFHEVPVEGFVGPDIGVGWVTYTQVQPIHFWIAGNLGVRYYF